MPLSDPACLDHTKWISQGILGQILECIHDKVLNSRIHSYHQPMPTICTTSEYQISNQNIPELRHDPDLASCTSLPSVGDPTGAESCTSASTTPTSDTTASDTDPGDAQNHRLHTTTMDGIQPVTNSS